MNRLESRSLTRRELVRAAFFASAVAPLAAALAACSPRPPAGGTKPTPANSALKTASDKALQVGDEVPAIKSEAIAGPEIDLARYRGQPFLISFWAKDCEPCGREFPLLKAALQRKSDLPILGFNVLDRKEEAQAFVEKVDATWPSIWDPDGTLAKRYFRVTALPVTMAVGRDFRLVDRIFGELDRNRLDSMIEAMFRS